jgi:hypothetical protein
MELGMYIMAHEFYPSTYFINPPISLCVCMCIHIVARQQLGKNITVATNTHAEIGEFLDAYFSMQSVSYQRRVYASACVAPYRC